MQARDIARLSCSFDSADFQYEYTIALLPNSSVGFTYQHYASDDIHYPRLSNVGAAVASDVHGHGQVVQTTYLPELF